jgi:DnaJ-class molecular chaperone
MTWIVAGIALVLVWQFVDKTIERGKKRSRRERDAPTASAAKAKPKAKGRPPRLPTPYEVLGVTPRMTDEQIATAYKKLVVQNHPDKLQDRPIEEREEAAARMREINEAYAALKDRPAPPNAR